MKKSKIIEIFAVLMAVLNIGMMVFISTNHKQHSKIKNSQRIIIDRLQFDESQIVSFNKLITQHQNNMMGEEQRIRALKNELYQTLIVQNNSAKDSLIQLIANEQLKLENIHFTHFLELKGLCRPEQMDEFKLLVVDIAKLFGKKRPPKKN